MRVVVSLDRTRTTQVKETRERVVQLLAERVELTAKLAAAEAAQRLAVFGEAAAKQHQIGTAIELEYSEKMVRLLEKDNRRLRAEIRRLHGDESFEEPDGESRN